MTAHNEAKVGEIAKTVLMPGDPLRAKYIAENFMENAILVNQVRGMLAYTGEYKGKEISVMAHGMGMPSVGIYAYELYQFYQVENIIRIGSCGSYVPEINLLDIVLVEESYTEGNFAYNFQNEKCNKAYGTKELNEAIEQMADKLKIPIQKVDAFCSECFDPYLKDMKPLMERLPQNIKVAEMEAFALFYLAKILNKKAACLLTVVDSICKKQELSAKQRQESLNQMIKLALETTIEL